MSFISRITARLPAFVSGGVTIAAVHVCNQYYKSSLSVPGEAPKQVLPTPWSDSSKYTKQPTPFATGDTGFSFGTASNYFFASRRGSKNRQSFTWSAVRPANCREASHLQDVAAKLFFVAITPHNDELVAFKDARTGTCTWKFCFNPDRYGQAPGYDSLQRWMTDNVSATESLLMKTSVVFGPGAACFARTADRCFRQDLPEHLERVMVEKQRSCLADDDEDTDKAGWIPRIVALGADRHYIAIWDDGRCISHLTGNNPMARYLEPDKTGIPVGCWENIVLNPHDNQDYFAVTKLGHIYWHTTEVMIRYQAYNYMQLRAKEDGLTYSMRSASDKGSLVNVTVSPDSDWTEDKLRTTLDSVPQSSLLADAVTYLRQLRKRWL